VTQIDDYTERVKRMVGKVHLQRHHQLRPRRLRIGGRRPRSRVRCAAASAGDFGGRAGRSPGFQGPPHGKTRHSQGHPMPSWLRTSSQDTTASG
jgi:hypothetical protein